MLINESHSSHLTGRLDTMKTTNDDDGNCDNNLSHNKIRNFQRVINLFKSMTQLAILSIVK